MIARQNGIEPSFYRDFFRPIKAEATDCGMVAKHRGRLNQFSSELSLNRLYVKGLCIARAGGVLSGRSIIN